MRAFRDTEVGGAAEVGGTVTGGAVHVAEIADVDERAVARLEQIVRVELDDAVRAHGGPVGAAVFDDLAVEARSLDEPALDRGVALLGAPGYRAEDPTLVKVDAHVEDMLELQRDRCVHG